MVISNPNFSKNAISAFYLYLTECNVYEGYFGGLRELFASTQDQGNLLIPYFIYNSPSVSPIFPLFTKT